MNRQRFSELSPDDLKNFATRARVERVWSRLRSDALDEPARPRVAWLWVPAALVIVFGSGVFVGKGFQAPQAPTVGPEHLTEPEQLTAAPKRTEPVSLPSSSRRGAHATGRSRASGHGSKGPSSDEQSTSEASVSGIVGGGTEYFSTEHSAAERRTPEWQRMADQGEYGLALKAVESGGGFDVVMDSASAEQLMTLADIARDTGEQTRAIQALRIVTERYSGDPNAPLAAMTLGNMLVDIGDRAGATAAFELNRRLSPKGDFAEDALARQFEVALDEGSLEEARTLLEQYAKDFPTGPRLAEIQAAFDKAAAEAAAVEAPVEQVPEAAGTSDLPAEPPPSN